ncbi:MAG: alpha/beta hydrolase [Oscillospiraceae bacterium]|jgi:pimeloyl-ACP methyl ester carboxylesterase|nr:alpha/beta hydrolase [Oscillospiraceae bacterium]
MRIDSCGVNINYEQYGSAGPQALLLHGWGCSLELWTPIIERLSPQMRLTAIDFPGHGKSGAPPEPWDAAAFARMTADIIERLELRGCAVIGHSHGGRVALRLAIDRPELIGKLVITCGAGLRGKPTPRSILRAKTYRALRGALNGLEKTRLFGDIPERGREALRARFGSKDYNALGEEMRKTFVLLVNTDLTDELRNIRPPTLLIWGEKDAETPLWMARVMEEKIPDAGLVVFEGAGHFAYIEQPDRFARIVEQFIL